ncbi:MAG: ubiquinol-cytochrome c reductase iron-sulfur subunit [Gemmatimonadota bacterium]|jgi:cytochrome b6-f complex iron-sulfur subunit|nr:MAG: ubiquinol-cytochrome c reductase iron-sulfur subunit [Gemmatimonadota bacterium]
MRGGRGDSLPTTRPTEAARTRRSFLARAWLWLGGIALGEYLWLAFEFLRPGSRSEPTGTSGAIVVAGPVGGFAPGSVTPFPEGRFYLARLADGGFLALLRECTHLGCTVPWLAAEDRFVCPCHASAYDITGTVLSPPAPRPLDLYAVRIEHGLVKVDTSRTIRRERFDPSQAVRS